MPLQNRVNPFGTIVSIPQRGMYTGNRGIIHNERQEIIKPFVLKAWITCTLHYKNFKREVMTERKWTELFFLDEATAFAAGHRPCAFCRNKDFKKFKSLWLGANAGYFPLHDEHMKAIDTILHEERMQLQKEESYANARLSSLPTGTMVVLKDDSNAAYLWQQAQLFKWEITGYAAPIKSAANDEVFVITPPSIVRTFAQGYRPVVHPTASLYS